MKHLGNICDIDWSKVEPVDVVTGGSPCQDLSVAGKRAGLAGERSGLFMEQIRCVKELRQADVQRGRTGVFIRPRFMVWENVPGAFSSGNPKGADFAAVIEEIIKVAEPGAVVHVCIPDRGWNKSGCYYAEDGSWSIAWRVHDAQFWGVPQRRKRIALFADFGGLSAPEILYERKGCTRNSQTSEAKGENIKDAYGKSLSKPVAFNIGSYNSNAWNSENTHSGIYETDVLKTLDAATCGSASCNQSGTVIVRPTLGSGKDVIGCLMANCGSKRFLGNQEAFSGDYTVIRGGLPYRPTVLECERAQGFPDNWTDIGEWIDSSGRPRYAKDSERYKALGNSIALPFWKWVVKRISAQYERDATLGSLFDGIGGFPYCWERVNGKGSARWASEIEEFPIAVTKLRFGED